MEDFLRNEHAKQYHGTDDDMPEDFDSWVMNLTNDEWIGFMEQFDKQHE